MNIDDMISDPSIVYLEIRNYIAQSANIKNPKAELDKLRTRYKSENKRSIDTAHKYIQQLIIPTRSPRSKILKHTIENDAVVEARLLLDSWITSQQAGNKFLTHSQIMQQAKEIATITKPTISQIQEAMTREKQLEYEGLE